VRRPWRHPLAEIVTSLPGMGILLTAELLVRTAGFTEYASPHELAAHAGLTPITHDSGGMTAPVIDRDGGRPDLPPASRGSTGPCHCT
jgi:transposase